MLHCEHEIALCLKLSQLGAREALTPCVSTCQAKTHGSDTGRTVAHGAWLNHLHRQAMPITLQEQWDWSSNRARC